jgi:mannose-6-phosphate isomerase-like protein (cupin superfamily)
MPFVRPGEAPNAPALDLAKVRQRMGPPPWRKPIVGTDATRWVLQEWPVGYVTIPHVHPRADEVFHVLAGHSVFRFEGEDADRRVGPGSVLFAPRGRRHTIGVPGPQPLLLLTAITPNEDAPDETIEEPHAPGVTL